MRIETTTIRTPDDRDLCIESFGSPSSPAIVFLSGTYEGRTLYPGLVESVKRHGLFVIGYDRPGYGGSSPLPGRVIADIAKDLRAISLHFQLSRLLTLGFSGGGSHAVAAAALLPDLVSASVAFCPIKPIDVDVKIDYVEPSDDESAPFANSALNREDLRDYARKERNEILAIDHDGIVAGNLNFAEKQRVSLAFLEFHYGSMKAALATGIEGCAGDLEAYYTPWGVDLASNQVPIKIWHGKADATVPYAHGQWLAGNTPHTELQLTEEDSHRSIFENSFEEAMGWLLRYK